MIFFLLHKQTYHDQPLHNAPFYNKAIIEMCLALKYNKEIKIPAGRETLDDYIVGLRGLLVNAVTFSTDRLGTIVFLPLSLELT